MARASIKRTSGIIGAALVLSAGVAVSTTFAAGSSKTTTVACKPDKQACQTGPMKGPKGSTAALSIADNDTATATLSGLFVSPTYNCTERGYTATSDQFVFDIQDFAAPAPGALVKTVTFAGPVAAGSPRVSDYQVCFAAPYKFPALDLRPSQLSRDARTGNYSDNTVPVADIGTGEPGYAGILPVCSANIKPNPSAGEQHAPCVASRTANTSAGVVTVVVQVPAADPAMRF